jgi:uncharacterized protein YqjF (DUF2071 family)
MNDGVFLTAQWQMLAFLNYEIAPKILAALVPAGTELDTWNGKTFVSVVGFRFWDTRVAGIRIPFHRNFEEVNLRFYVRHRGPEGWRRGVVFIKELAPRTAIAWVARWFYNEQYLALPMRHKIRQPSPDRTPTVEYSWRLGERWQGLSAEAAGSAELPEAGSQEEFITEHYWGYTTQRDGSTLEYRVEHPRWPVWQAAHCAFDGDVARLYGPQLVECLADKPSSAFVAAGSAISVFKGVRV